MPSSSTKTIGIGLAVIAALSLAITNVGIPVIYRHGSNPQTLLMLRAVSTVLIIGVLLIATGRMKRLSGRLEFYSAISGVMFMFAGFGLLSALAIAPVSSVVLVLYLFPLIATLLDAAARRSPPSLWTLVLMGIALCGLYLALDPGGEKLNFFGLLLALGAAISAGSTLVWNNHMLSNVDPEQITFRMFIISLLVFGAYAVSTNSIEFPQSSFGNWMLVFILVCFGIAFTAMFRGAQMAGSVHASMIMNLEPIASIFLAVLFLAETLNATQYFGAGLVLSAIILSQLPGRRKGGLS